MPGTSCVITGKSLEVSDNKNTHLTELSGVVNELIYIKRLGMVAAYNQHHINVNY